MPNSGTKLGPYEILSPLSEGGMGEVEPPGRRPSRPAKSRAQPGDFMLNPGAKLGCYEIVSPLGAGGTGEVYRARDTKLGRELALNVLPEAFAKDAARMARFRREAQVLASLNHPNIATIYDLEESNGTCALVMELVEGPTLAERIP
jgi:serine/threonine protein kinase